MKIIVIGTGYVGLVTGTCFAEMGNDVVCVEIVKDFFTLLTKRAEEVFNEGYLPCISGNF